MKKIKLLALAVSVLLLAGCAGTETPETLQTTLETETQAMPETRIPTVPPETTEAPEPTWDGRPKEIELPLMFEGTEDSVPMTLWERPAYSLYFPQDGGFYMEFTEDQGLQVDRYSTIRNPLIEFSVVYLGEGEELASYDYLKAAYPDLDVSTWDIGTWTGSNMETMEMLEARYKPGEGNSYLLVAKYPLEAAEGFGVQFTGMMGTFLINE